jgi:hypothetical protein
LDVGRAGSSKLISRGNCKTPFGLPSEFCNSLSQIARPSGLSVVEIPFSYLAEGVVRAFLGFSSDGFLSESDFLIIMRMRLKDNHPYLKRPG